MMNAEDMAERFLKADANVDYMAAKLAALLRNCMRAAADVASRKPIKLPKFFS